ncbi:MAG: ABC transporter permease [Bacillales bacterium]|jgi:simple sugar transport system permease protein|nr:ABC transporter permease [Bacillales bacterium]
MNSLYLFLGQVLIIAIPLIVTALGGMFTERSGVINIALEGIMIIGAFVGILFLNVIPFKSDGTGFLAYFLGMFFAGLAGALVGLLHGVASIKMKGDQTISATAINTLIPALCILLTVTFNISGVSDSEKFQIHNAEFLKIDAVPLLSQIPVIGDIFFQRTSPSLYFGIIIIIISWIVINKTRFGLRLKACGENPSAADSAGINPIKYRYFGVALSGILAGVGGFFLVTGYSSEFMANSTASYGFLALAIMIFGNWKPGGIVGGAILFATLVTLSSGLAYFPFLENLLNRWNIDKEIIHMLPYITTIIVLIFASKNSHAPASEGIPYEK